MLFPWQPTMYSGCCFWSSSTSIPHQTTDSRVQWWQEIREWHQVYGFSLMPTDRAPQRNILLNGFVKLQPRSVITPTHSPWSNPGDSPEVGSVNPPSQKEWQKQAPRPTYIQEICSCRSSSFSQINHVAPPVNAQQWKFHQYRAIPLKFEYRFLLCIELCLIEPF